VNYIEKRCELKCKIEYKKDFLKKKRNELLWAEDNELK